MILAAIQIADVEIYTAHAFAQGAMRRCQSNQTDAIRMEENDVILVAGARSAVVKAREKPIHNARTVGVEIVTDRGYGLAANHHRLLVEVEIAEAHHGFGLNCSGLGVWWTAPVWYEMLYEGNGVGRM